MGQISYYPHLVVTNIQKVSTEIEDVLIPLELNPSTILQELNTAAEADDAALEGLETIAQTHYDSESVLTSTDALKSLYPAFDNVVEALSTDDPSTLTAPTDDQKAILTEEEHIWDSLIVNFILNQDTGFISELVTTVKIIATIKKWEAGDFSDGTEVLEFWDACYVQFPKPLFPLPKRTAPEITGEPADEVEDNVAELLADIEKYEDAREDLVDAFELQIARTKKDLLSQDEFTADFEVTQDGNLDEGTRKTDPPPVSAGDAFKNYEAQVYPEELAVEFYDGLKNKTKNVLKDLGLGEAEINVPLALRRMDRQVSKFGAQMNLDLADQVIVLIGNQLIEINNAVYEEIICKEEPLPTHCELLQQLVAQNPDKSYVQVLGTGYANIIRQDLVRYEADEIAHVENVLQGESKEKTHRNLKTREEFFLSESETSEETETDTKTSERFSLSKEVSEQVSSSSSFEAGLNVSASYGPVSFGANLGYTSTSSASEATAIAVQNSREVTQRAVSRLQSRILEQRSTKTINEVEVTNVHGINNEDGDGHINGFYYWIDKVYENQVYNIGKRLMLEFLIPEPAAYHIFSKAFARVEGVTLDKPIHPSDFLGSGVTAPLKSHKNLTRANYHIWTALYGAQGIVEPPQEIVTIGRAYSKDMAPGDKGYHALSFNDLEVPGGYEAELGYFNCGFSTGSGRYVTGFLGTKRFSTSINTTSPIILSLNQERGIVPFSIRARVNGINMNVEVVCRLAEDGFEKWQIQTYDAIIAAYEQRRSEYDSAVAAVESAVTIQGQNPLLNRKVEQTELKKWSLELLTLQRFDGFNAMLTASGGEREMDFAEALNEGTFVKFFEQAIEWENMTYIFYPYFWANKPRWTTISQLSDVDVKFQDFLQAGYARVVVPVHPKFTDAMLHYLNSGEVWLGEGLPTIDDPLYVSVVEEIREAEEREDDEPIGDSWETTVPTNLVILTDEIPYALPGSETGG